MKNLTYNELIEKDIFGLIGAPKSMSDEEKQALILKMYKTIENRVIARIGDKLSEAEIQEFDEKMKISQKVAFEYLLSLGINLPKLITEEAIVLKNELCYLTKGSSLKE